MKDVVIEVILDKKKGGAANFIGWKRLVEQLTKAKEIRSDEVVTHLQVGEHGIEYLVRKK